MVEDEGVGRAPELADLRVARTPFEARIIAAVLEDAGIPAHVGSSLLSDEFAASQRLMNLQAVVVQVPADRVAAAEAALQAAKHSAALLADGDVDVEVGPEAEREVELRPPAAGSARGWAFAVVFALLALAFGALWLDARADHWRHPLWDVESGPGVTLYRWRDTGLPMSRLIDRDGDGIAERQQSFDRRGELAAEARDADADGTCEELVEYGPAGEVAVAEDRDGDGVHEVLQVRYPEGVAEYRDTDGDRRLDALRLLDAAGKVVARQEFQPGQGWVTKP